MTLRNTRDTWGWPARLLHWIMAVMILGMIGSGLYAANAFGVDFDDLMARKDLTQIHKSFGFTVFTLACLRILWRAVSRTPDPPEGARNFEKAIARGGHIALYLLMFAVPLTGWLMASASTLNDPDAYPEPIPNMVFGLFHMPDPYPEGDRDIAGFWGAAHFWLAMSLAVLLTTHALAATWHHFVRGDTVLMRMLTGKPRRRAG